MKPAGSPSRRVTAILQALLVAFLWSTSWVLIKDGLQEIPPLVFAGVRYFLAFLILLAAFLIGLRKAPAVPLPRRMWGRLIVFGLFTYAIAQGAMFVALLHLPAVTLNLALNFTSLGVALVGAAWLSEKPTIVQWAGIALSIVGAVVYFYPAAIPRAQIFGLVAALICLSANILSTVVGREINGERLYPSLQLTLVSMGAGSIILLTAGLVVEGVPSISPRNWMYILWLAAVNTAFAFTMWNHTLRTLTAAESSISTGTMLLWIPILAVLFLGETLTVQQVLGLVAVGAGAVLVQLRGRAEVGGGP